jgi:hypothetical protein
MESTFNRLRGEPNVAGKYIPKNTLNVYER